MEGLRPFHGNFASKASKLWCNEAGAGAPTSAGLGKSIRQSFNLGFYNLSKEKEVRRSRGDFECARTTCTPTRTTGCPSYSTAHGTMTRHATTSRMAKSLSSPWRVRCAAVRTRVY
eukprot:scaffold198722_cov38-Tisochrysis_lutea.AAC.2